MPSNNRNPTVVCGDEIFPLFKDQNGSHAFQSAGIRWVCPYCGEPWARMEGTGDPIRRPWHIVTWPCIKHGLPYSAGWGRGGAILPYLKWHPREFLFPTDTDLIQSISQSLINHEAKTRSLQILKGINHDHRTFSFA